MWRRGGYVFERERKEEDILPEKLQEENESYMEVCVGGSALVLWVVLMTTLTCIESSWGTEHSYVPGTVCSCMILLCCYFLCPKFVGEILIYSE